MMKPYYEEAGITLYCGDALEILPQLTEEFDATITDPPYGIDYQSARRTDRTQFKPKIANDKKPFIWFLPFVYRLTKDAGSLICFCRWDVQEAFRWAIDLAGYTVKSQAVWDRESHGMGDLNGSIAPQHDIIWFGAKGDFHFHDTRPKSVFRAMRLTGEQLLHPNEKPVSLMRQVVEPFVPINGSLLDCFAGSGPTLIAAKSQRRKAVGIELSESNCEIAARRLENTTVMFDFTQTIPETSQAVSLFE